LIIFTSLPQCFDKILIQKQLYNSKIIKLQWINHKKQYFFLDQKFSLPRQSYADKRKQNCSYIYINIVQPREINSTCIFPAKTLLQFVHDKFCLLCVLLCFVFFIFWIHSIYLFMWFAFFFALYYLFQTFNVISKTK
jgi:hypothetical protein